MIWSSKDKYFVLFKLIILQNTFRKTQSNKKRVLSLSQHPYSLLVFILPRLFSKFWIFACK